MDIQIEELSGVKAVAHVNAIQIIADKSGNVGLYAESFGLQSSSDDGCYRYLATMDLYDVAKDATALLNPVLVPTMLNTPPLWQISPIDQQKCRVAYTSLGGGWETLSVGVEDKENLDWDYKYSIEQTNNPHFVLNSGDSEPKQQLVSAVFSGYQLGLIGLMKQGEEMEEAPAVSGLVGTSDKPVAGGYVYGNFTEGIPPTFYIIYKENDETGALSPDGQQQGRLFVASYDYKNSQLSSPIFLFEDLGFTDFDVALHGDYCCLFAITGDGAPFLTILDREGKVVAAPALPVGVWNNAGNWASHPTVIETKSPKEGEIAFRFAFKQMKDLATESIQTGLLSFKPTS